MIEEYDEPILKHLLDIKAVTIKEPMSFNLEFHFEPNDYFTNTVLTKSYELRCTPDPTDVFAFEGPEIVKCKGFPTTLNWHADVKPHSEGCVFYWKLHGHKYVTATPQDIEGIPPDQQRLIFAGKQLDDVVRQGADIRKIRERVPPGHQKMISATEELENSTRKTITLDVEPSDTVLRHRGSMQIFVKTLTGDTIALDVEPTDSIKEVKAKIEEKEAISSCHQLLVYSGSLLHDCQSLSYYEIKRESTLHLKCKLKGGSDDHSGLTQLSSDLSQLLCNRNHSDVILKVGSSSFPAHLNILQYRAPELYALLEESTDSEFKVIKMNDCSPEAFKLYLTYIYSATLNETVKWEHVLDLYSIAIKFRNASVKGFCLSYLMINLDYNNLFSIAKLAKSNNERSLELSVQGFFSEHYKTIVMSDKFSELLADPDLAIWLLRGHARGLDD